MSKQIRNKFKYDIPIYHRPIISVDEATAYSGIGRTKLYELTTMENCPFVIWVGTRRVIKRKSFVTEGRLMKEKMIYHYGNEKSLLVMKQPHIPELVLEG